MGHGRHPNPWGVPPPYIPSKRNVQLPNYNKESNTIKVTYMVLKQGINKSTTLSRNTSPQDGLWKLDKPILSANQQFVCRTNFHSKNKIERIFRRTKWQSISMCLFIHDISGLRQYKEKIGYRQLEVLM